MILRCSILLLCLVTNGVLFESKQLSNIGSKLFGDEKEFDRHLNDKIERMFAKEITKIVTKWENEKAQMQQQIRFLEQKLEKRFDMVHSDPRKRLLIGINSTFQGQTHPSQVAFFARNVTPYKNLSLHETLKFAVALTNVGNCYHSATGIFVCYTSGYYVFTVSIILDPGTGLRMSLVQNGVSKEQFLCDNGIHYHYCGSTIILHVQAGDTISVRTESSMSTHLIGWESSFSGFLLYED